MLMQPSYEKPSNTLWDIMMSTVNYIICDELALFYIHTYEARCEFFCKDFDLQAFYF